MGQFPHPKFCPSDGWIFMARNHMGGGGEGEGGGGDGGGGEGGGGKGGSGGSKGCGGTGEGSGNISPATVLGHWQWW